MSTLMLSAATALELIASDDPALWTIVGRSLAVSASACLLASGFGLVLGAYLAVGRFRGRGACLTLLNTLLAVFMGTLLAVGVALVRELMDRRIRSLDDAVTALGLPVLGVMPKPGGKGRAGLAQLSLMQQRLMAPLPPTGKGA